MRISTRRAFFATGAGFGLLALPRFGNASTLLQDIEDEFAETPQGNVSAVTDSSFRRALRQAIRERYREGGLTRKQRRKMLTATFSPAFLVEAERLALIQMEFSGEDLGDIPTNAAGHIDARAINWEGLIAFLKVLIPFLLELLGGIGGD